MRKMLSLMAITVALLMNTACSVVGPGERGVRVSLGKASSEVMEPGAYLWFPVFLGNIKYNVQVQKSDIKTSAASKDMQDVTTDVAVNWSITPDKVVDLVKTVGDEDDILIRIIQPAVSEVLKAAMAKKNAEELLTHRMELKKEIDDALNDRLAKSGVTLEGVSIMNFEFSAEFAQAIEQKQIAEQKAKQAEYTAQQATQEANAQINRARGQAEAQRLTMQTLTPAILQKMAIDKWDGAFPQYMAGGGGALPFINLTPPKNDK